MVSFFFMQTIVTHTRSIENFFMMFESQFFLRKKVHYRFIFEFLDLKFYTKFCIQNVWFRIKFCNPIVFPISSLTFEK